MGTPSANQYFEAIHTGPGTPADPNLFSAPEIVAGSFGSAAISAATSSVVSTAASGALDSVPVSAASSRAVSAAVNASIADSKAVSGSANTSIADSKALSVSVNTSVADSKGVSIANSVPILTVVANSQNVSTADSKAVSVASSITLAATNATTVIATGVAATDTTNLQNAVTAATAGGSVRGSGDFVTNAPIVFPPTSVRIKFFTDTGATMVCAHNGDGITAVATNENYGGHTFEGWTITGPNTAFPAGGYVPPSTGAAINMSRDATTNAVTSYNGAIRDCVLQQFKYGLNMQCAIGTIVDGKTLIRFNQYGVYIDGGQTNANHFFGTHIRENRIAGIYSTGRTGGSLTNATANTFHAPLIETNLPYAAGYASGGTPPTDSVGIYLNNSYNFVFDGCYSENHAASIYLTGGSKYNKFHKHRTNPGTGRVEGIYLVGPGVYSNDFDIHCESASLSEVSVVSDNADQLYNKFTGSGVNFVTASVVAPLDFSDIKPSLDFANSRGVGLIRMPHQGYMSDASEGAIPGCIEGVGTTAAILHSYGYGEIRLGTGITANTTIITIDGLLPHSFFTLTNLQATWAVTIKSSALSGGLVLYGGRDVVLNAAGQSITFYVNGAGKLYEVGRSFANQVFAGNQAGGVTPATMLGAVGAAYGGVGYNLTGSAPNYIVTDYASQIRFASGGFEFLTAPSGTAGAAITLTRMLYLLQTGQLQFTNIGATPTGLADGQLFYDGTNLRVRLAGVTRTVTVT